MKRYQLDEMQAEKRNKIGHQSYLLLAYLLLAEMGLNGFGIRWAAYPVNIMALLLVVMSLYLVRCIAANAYVGPGNSSPRVVKLSVLTMAVSAGTAAALAVFLPKGLPEGPEQSQRGAMILFLVPLVSFIIIGITSYIRYRRDRETEES